MVRFAKWGLIGWFALTLTPCSPLFASVRLQIREGRPIVDGVYVNRHGPYRFILDTGTNVNMIEERIAQAIGMEPAFRIELASATGVRQMPGSDGNEIELGPARGDAQQFIFGDLRTIREHWPDVQGVLGQWFLSRFDYTLDLRGKQLEFGKRVSDGSHTPLTTLNGRSAVTTSLGDLVLDSGAPGLILFGVEPERSTSESGLLRTLTGSQLIGKVARSLAIGGKSLWRGEAVAIPNQAEPGVAGLMPLSLFKSVYVCNSENYAVFE